MYYIYWKKFYPTTTIFHDQVIFKLQTMRNLTRLISCTICLFTLVLSSCGERSQEGQDVKKAEVKPPEQIISIEEAKSMYDNYTERRAGLIQHFEDSINIGRKDTAQFDVARYTYYDYKTIKQYLAYIEQEAAAAGVEISSLRFYYSNYPDQQNFANGKPIVHPRQNSFFLIPALEVEGEQYAFTTVDTGEAGKKRAVLLTMDLEPYEPDGMGAIDYGPKRSHAGIFSLVSYTSPAYANGSTVLNEGNAAPPPFK